MKLKAERYDDQPFLMEFVNARNEWKMKIKPNKNKKNWCATI